MKTLTLNVLKKNRKYFACKHNGYDCKLLIDENSEKLELGEQALVLNDISVRTKYGTDVIYSLSAPADKQKSAGICTLKTEFYNSKLVDKCRELGGRFDESEKTWVFSDIVLDKVEELDAIYNSELVSIELMAKRNIYFDRCAASFLGLTIAKATDRDSGAFMFDGISLVYGDKPTSGGSRKNWDTKIFEGSVFRFKIPKELLSFYDESNDKWELKIIDSSYNK